MSAMSNLLTPVDPHVLEAVTGGTTTTPRSSSSSNDQLLQTLTGIASTIKDLGNTANKSGFSMTEVLMLGLLMNQNRGGQVDVFVRRPHW
jgi:phage-related minor tail protein